MKIDYQRLQEDAETGGFFQIYFEIDLHEWTKQNGSLLTELELQKIEKQAQKTKIKSYGKNSSITTENWEQHKETFFTQRMATYRDSYTLTEKIKLELLRLEELTINATDYKVLNDRYRAYLEQKQSLSPQQKTNENETVRYTAKHYVLAYLIECNAKGESFPIGQKKELEKIGSQRIGAGKGHRFYREFNNIINNYDINKLNHLIEIGGENWRTIVKDLSNKPETIETYLQSKQL